MCYGGSFQLLVFVRFYATFCGMKQEDSPNNAGAPVTEEVTPAMIKAGDRCLDELFDATLDPGSESGLTCIPGGWAEAVYRAMRRCARPAASDPKDLR